MSEVNGVSSRPWRIYGSFGLTLDGDLSGPPEGSRKLELRSADGKTATVPAGHELVVDYAANMGVISPYGLGARLGVTYADGPSVSWNTTDAEAEQAGAKAGDYATVRMRSSLYRLKFDLTYTLDLSQRFSITAGAGPLWSHIEYCSATAENSHLVGSGGTEHANPLAVCAAIGAQKEDRFGINSFVEGAINVWEVTSLVAGVAYTAFPSFGSTWSASLSFRLLESF